MCVDRLDEARELFEAQAVDAERRGDDYTYSSLLVYLVELECRAASFPAAAAHASECWLRSEQRGEHYQGGAALRAKALVDAHLGRTDEARAAAERGVTLSNEIGEEVYRVLNRFALGFLELSLGNMAGADAVLRLLPTRLVQLGWDEPSLFPVWPNAIEALIGLGEHDLAPIPGHVRGAGEPMRLSVGARHGRALPGPAAPRGGRRRGRAGGMRAGPP